MNTRVVYIFSKYFLASNEITAKLYIEFRFTIFICLDLYSVDCLTETVSNLFRVFNIYFSACEILLKSCVYVKILVIILIVLLARSR